MCTGVGDGGGAGTTRRRTRMNRWRCRGGKALLLSGDAGGDQAAGRRGGGEVEVKRRWGTEVAGD